MNFPRRPAFLALAATLVILASVRSSHATTILSYSISDPVNNPLLVTDDGTVTTFANNFTNNAAPALKVTLTLSNGNLPSIQQSAFLNFYGFSSTAAVIMAGSLDIQTFQGVMAFTSNANGTGIDYLTATFNNLTYVTTDDSQAGSASQSSKKRTGPKSINFISTYYTFPNQNLPTTTDALSLGVTDLVPNSSIDGSTIAGFTSNLSGNFSTVPPIVVNPRITPEPSTLAGAAVACVVAFGFFRRRNAKAA